MNNFILACYNIGLNLAKGGIMDNQKVVDLGDILPEVVLRADSEKPEKVETQRVDSDEPKDEPKKEEAKADEGAENVNSDEPKDSDIVGLNVDLPAEPKDDEPQGELIESEVLEDDDKKRDNFWGETRDICDSADWGVDVKMPMLKGRHTYRSAVFSFAKLNPKFVDKKYSNLRLDSLTNELCDEIKQSMFSNIAKTKPNTKAIVNGFVDSGNGYKVQENF